MNPQLFPKPAKRMKQPSKELLREQLATAADEIIRLRAEALANEQRISGYPAEPVGGNPK